MTEELTNTIENPISEIKSLETKGNELTNLSNKEIKYRALYKQTVSDIEEIKARHDSVTRDMEDKINNLQKSQELMTAKMIESQLAAQAVAEGLTDLDLVKLIDTTNIAKNDKGEIIGIKEAIADFKSRKPNFFGKERKTSSSTNAEIPVSESRQTNSAFEMPKDVWNKLMRSVPHSVG